MRQPFPAPAGAADADGCQRLARRAVCSALIGEGCAPGSLKLAASAGFHRRTAWRCAEITWHRTTAEQEVPDTRLPLTRPLLAADARSACQGEAKEALAPSPRLPGSGDL